MKRKLLSVACGTALMTLAVGGALAVTPFETDVGISITKGLAWQKAQGYYTGGAGSATGLSLLALLEKRASGLPSDPPQGYSGANATDQGDMRSAISYMLGVDPTSSLDQYGRGNFLMAVVVYARSGGPDRGAHADLPAGLPYDLRGWINAAVDVLLARQAASGYWCYDGPGCDDSSTTQFAAAGLAAAKSYYSDPLFGDPGARIPLINAALAKARQGYINNAAQGSDYGAGNGDCQIMEATERGHGYNVGWSPSLQQTASGTWVQMLGGADLNDASVQNYLRWLKNHYRWQDLNSMGNSWPTNSYWYFLWSSFKAMEFMRASGVTPNPGNLGPDSLGLLGPAVDPNPADALPGLCSVRQVHRDPATLSGPSGSYSAEAKSQYFDYASQILASQCADGSYACHPSSIGFGWSWVDAQAYALLVLQRATGGACVDTDGDGICDSEDNCPAVSNPIPPGANKQVDTDGDGVGDACDNCPTVPNPNQDPNACRGKCDVDKDGDIDKNDLALISKNRGKTGLDQAFDADSDGKITPNDVKVCIPKCTRPNCATSVTAP